MALQVPLTRNGGEYRMSSTPFARAILLALGCREAGTAGKIEGSIKTQKDGVFDVRIALPIQSAAVQLRNVVMQHWSCDMMRR
jgi:hypothetical protein